MDTRILAITASAFMLLGAATSASAQSTEMQPPGQQQPSTSEGSPRTMGPGMMRDGGMMGVGMMRSGMMHGGMMGGGMMRHHAMANPLMLRMIFALIDEDGDGTVSLQEFQAAHERIFRAMDANKDGVLTPDEMTSFVSGVSGPDQQ